jgi:putative ABC transport system permease protein
MSIQSRVPLAWLNLTRDKRRFVVSVAGISFAVILMFVETGFYFALFDSTVSLLARLNGELIMTSRSKDALPVSNPFSLSRLDQVRGFAGVQAAWPLYIERMVSLWKNPDHPPGDPGVRPIRVLAFNLDDEVLLIPEIYEYREQLQQVDTALIDVKSKKFYGLRQAGIERELAHRNLRIVGTFKLGTDFTNDGNLIMSARNFARFFPIRGDGRSPLNDVELGVIKLKPGVDPLVLREALLQQLPGDVKILTRQEFIDQEKALWRKSSPIGAIFTMGTVIGFIVGIVICYQVLSTDIADHLSEYATLKAIGYTNGYLNGVVLQEAVYLSFLGYLPGLAISYLLYTWLRGQTGLPMDLTLLRGGLILILTIVMCIISGSIAIRKVQAADPAEVF